LRFTAHCSRFGVRRSVWSSGFGVWSSEFRILPSQFYLLYLDVLDTLGMRPYVVLTVRHPAEVIRSIVERNDLEPATIELLWLRHVLEAETASRSCRRVWTSYERLLQSWAHTAQSIASGPDITWPNEPQNVRPVIEGVLATAAPPLSDRSRSSSFGPSDNLRLGSLSALRGRERGRRKRFSMRSMRPS